jgi:glycerol-3-phosphate dehydrogenase subunit B
VRAGDEWEIFDDGGSLMKADAVIVAHGGFAAGGLLLESNSQRATARFRTALDAPIHVALDDKILDIASSLYGVDVQALGISVLERVGLFTQGLRVPGQQRLFVAGAALANRPRTVLQAVSSGIEAGVLAASAGPA